MAGTTRTPRAELTGVCDAVVKRMSRKTPRSLRRVPAGGCSVAARALHNRWSSRRATSLRYWPKSAAAQACSPTRK